MIRSVDSWQLTVRSSQVRNFRINRSSIGYLRYSLILLFFIFYPNYKGFSQCDRVIDSLELVKFYNNFNGDNWTNSWDLNEPIDSWYGVSLFFSNGCIRKIDLSQNNLHGQLFDLNLPTLQILTLDKNSIIGEIPDFQNLESLEDLILEFNSLEGQLPDFSNLVNLEQINLRSNNLNGVIPDFSNLPNLTTLSLSENEFSGVIPNFSGISKVVSLNLSRNNLIGGLPNFTQLPKLFLLDLTNNQLSEILPDITSNAPSLFTMNINFNQFTFEDIIPSFENYSTELNAYFYNNQEKIFSDTLINVHFMDNLIIDLGIDDTVTTSTYNWYKDSLQFLTTTVNSLSFPLIDTLDSGKYYCEVTNSKVPFMTLKSHLIEIIVDPTSCDIELSNSTFTNPTCETLNDGQIHFEISGGQPYINGFYDIKWQNFPIELQDSVATLSGLPAGNYCVEITDSENCTKEFCFDLVNQRTYDLLINKQNINCFGDSTGLIDLNVDVAGLPGLPYEFEWQSANNFTQIDETFTSSISGLEAGIYSITVTDADGCIITTEEEVTEPNRISATLQMTKPITCFGGDGTFEITNISGGVSTFFQYKIDDGDFQNSTIPSQLSAGNYHLIIKESQTGCEWDSTFVIQEPPILDFDTLQIFPQTCKDILDGGLRFRVSGGALFQGGYYNMDIQNLGFFQTDRIDTTDLITGTYNILVTDANGCTLTGVAEVPLLKKLSLDSSIEHVECHGDASGKILATIITDGIPNDDGFNFEWSNLPLGNTPFNNNNASFVDNLPAGIYSLLGQDMDGCAISETFEVIEPLELIPEIDFIEDASCPEVNNGTAQISISGGTSPYEAMWNSFPPQNGQTASQLSSGNYIVTITDSNNCSATQIVQISAGLPPQIDSIFVQNESCIAPGSGSATLIATSGGTPSYSYLWSTNPPQTDTIATNLSSGFYQVVVTDKNGCTSSTELEVLADVLPEISLLEDDSLLCSNDSDGSLEVFMHPTDAPPLTFEWSNGGTTSTIENLMAGIYYLTVTDNKKCEIIDSVFVNEPTQIVATIPQPDLPRCTGDETFLTVSNATGGNGMPYFFSINDHSNHSIGDSLSIQPDTYNITIIDSEGCEIDTLITAEERPELILNIKAEDVFFCEEISIKTLISDPGRIGENSVQWEILDGGDGILSCTDCIDPILFPGDDISYHLKVEVVDTNGCRVVESIKFDRIQIPDLFTPNGDGANDFFEIRVCDNLQSFDNELIVFNQWGDIVFESEDYSNNWNGRFKGKELPEASYYFLFKIEVEEQIIERKGRIAILR